MRISVVSGFFLPVPPVAGGAMEKIWFRLAREFVAAGHEVTHVSRSWRGFPDEEVIDSIRMIRVRGFGHRRSLLVNLALDLLFGWQVARALPAGDIVVCNTVSLPVYLARVRPSAGRVVAVLGRMPKGHGRFYRQVDRLIAPSEAVRAKLVRENPRLASRTRVVPNPIDWTLHQQAHAARGPLTIGYVGRLHPEKGLELLLSAVSALPRDTPSWRLRLIGLHAVGEGGGGSAYVEQLRQLAAPSDARVSIEPPIYNTDELARIYASFDIFVYPSLAEKGEGLSVAPLEAMAAGAVPVVSALECYAGVVRDGENGVVFNHRAPERTRILADCLARLLRDPALRSRLGENARRDAQRFDYRCVAADLLKDFSELLGFTTRGYGNVPSSTAPNSK